MTPNNDLVPKSLLLDMADRRKKAKDWSPWPYQELGVQMMLEDGQCGLLLDPGMGKTSTTLAASTILLKKKLVKRVLIVAPLRAVYEVWPLEIADWKDFHHLGAAILHGGSKDKVLRMLRPEHQLCFINFEGLQWLLGSKERMKLLDADMLVIDESSKMKNSQAVRFKALRPHLLKFKRCYILTGSPRPRNYLDLFGQIYILDRGAALGSYITTYRNNFFYPTGYQMREWAPLPDSPKQIDALVAPMVLRLDAKDYLKLPEVPPDKTHRVELPPAARKEYDLVEDTLMSKLFTAPLVSSAAARSKCCQMANGAVYTDAPVDEDFPTKARTVKVLHTAKVEALVDLHDELQGEPLLVSIGFKHDVEAIRKALGKDLPCINGATTRGQTTEYIKAWNAGKLPLLLGHPASMGHGLNLQGCGCRHVAFFDIPDDYDLYDQFFRRVWRQGNKSAFVFRHHFVATDTVDVGKMKNLARKGSGQRDFLKAMKEYSEERRKARLKR